LELFRTRAGVECVQQLKAPGAKPRMAERDLLDKEGGAFLVALEQVLPVVTELSRYYTQADFKDDGFAKGRTLDLELKAALERYLPASAHLRRSLAPLRQARFQLTLARVQEKYPVCKNGGCLAFWVHQLMGRAAALADSLFLTDDPDEGGLARAIEAYDKAQRELEAFYGKAQREPMMDLFEHKSRWILEAAKEVKRSRTGRSYSSAWQLSRFAEQYREMEQQYRHAFSR